MRSLQAAALAVAAPFFSASVLADGEQPKPIAYSQVVTLPLPAGEDGFEIVALRLDVHVTETPCDPSAVSVWSQSLGQESGEGALLVEDGRRIDVKWHFTCDDPAQFLDMTIKSFDNDFIPHVSFTTHLPFSSRHADAYPVTVGKPQVNDAPSVDDDEAAMRDLRRAELKAQMDQLEELREQVVAIEEEIEQEESDAGGMSFIEHSPVNIAESIEDCHTRRCMWHNIKAKVKATVKLLREKIDSAHKLENHYETVLPGASEQTLRDDMVSQASPAQQQPNFFTMQDMKVSESPRAALLSALCLAVLAFSLVTFFSLLYTHRDRIRAALKARRAGRRQRRLRTWAERLAASEARKKAIKDFVCRVFRGLVDFDAEKRAEEEERRRALAERQAEEGRHNTVLNEENTSMEEELASLRVAAAMVDELISGRRPAVEREQLSQGHRQQQQQQMSEPPQISPMPTIPGFVTYDDHLPTYEEQIHDSAVVADGFRFQPDFTQSERFHHHIPQQQESSSDRLGYNK